MTSTADLELAWETEFPGTSHLQKTLRQILVHSDILRLKSESLLTQLEEDLDYAQLPMPLWDKRVATLSKQVEQSVVKTQRHFFLALRNLQANYKPKAIKSPSTEPAAPLPERPKRPYYRYQTIYFHYDESGAMLPTTAGPNNLELLQSMPHQDVTAYIRAYTFPDFKIPEPYAHLATHNGVTYETRLNLLVTYSIDTFKDLMLAELATTPKHVLDGERIGYEWRGPNKEENEELMKNPYPRPR